MKLLASVTTILVVMVQRILAIGKECARLTEGNFYEFGPLRRTTEDYMVKVNPEKSDGEKTHTLYFNFCGPTLTQCTLEDRSKTRAQAVLMGPGDTPTCRVLTMPHDDVNFRVNQTLIKANKYDAIGLRVLYNNTKTTIGVQSYFNLEMNLICNKEVNATNTVFKYIKMLKTNETWAEGENLQTFQVEADTKYGCPVYESHYLVQMLDNFKYLYVVLAFVIGLVECFYGHKIFKPTLFLIGFLAGFIATCLFLFSIWPGTVENQSTRFWAVFSFSIITGLAAGFFLPSLTRLGLTVSGGALGFFLAMIFYGLFLFKFKSLPAELLFQNFLIWSTIVGLIFGYEFHEHILILSTSVIGAEQFVRSMGILIGGYPNEIEMIDQLNQGMEVKLETSYIIYFICIGLVAAAGVWNQYRLKKLDILRGNGQIYLQALARDKMANKKGGVELLEEKYSKASD